MEQEKEGERMGEREVKMNEEWEKWGREGERELWGERKGEREEEREEERGEGKEVEREVVRERDQAKNHVLNRLENRIWAWRRRGGELEKRCQKKPLVIFVVIYSLKHLFLEDSQDHLSLLSNLSEHFLDSLKSPVLEDSHNSLLPAFVAFFLA